MSDEGEIQGPVTASVWISRSRYEELLADERWRLALEDAGVDNWRGYSIAMASLREGEGDDA